MSVLPCGSREYWNALSPASISFYLLKVPSASVTHSLENTPMCILLSQIVIVKSVELVVLEMLSKCLLDWFPNSVAGIYHVRDIISRDNSVSVFVCV